MLCYFHGAEGGILDGVGSFSLQLDLSYNYVSNSEGQETLVRLLPASKKNSPLGGSVNSLYPL